MAFDFSQAAGLGTESIDKSVLGPPFLNIIQKGSPEFDETHQKYAEKKIEGCRPGQILFEPERAIIPAPVQVIPIAQTALYTEWKPNKGGFVGNRTTDVVGQPGYRKGIPGSENEHKEYLGQNELVFTITFMVLFLHKGEWKKGLIAFTSSQLKIARQWSRALLGTKIPGTEQVAPIFAAKYELDTFADANKKGGFFSWRLKSLGVMNAETEQALLEQAFDATKSAQLLLPRAKEPLALAGQAAPVAVVEAADTDAPY